MIDTKELREIGATMDELNELLDRLEAAEKERDNANAAAAGIALQAETLQAERDTLRAKIEAMEKQEPVWFVDERGEPKRYHKSKADYCKYGGLDLLYALPGAQAQPAPSNLAEAIIEDLQAQYDTEGITENDSGDALIRLSDAIAAVEDNFVLAQPAPSVPDGWREAAVAWEVCASIHREYARGKDPFFSTRQGDFAKHAQDARDMLVSAQKPEGE